MAAPPAASLPRQPRTLLLWTLVLLLAACPPGHAWAAGALPQQSGAKQEATEKKPPAKKQTTSKKKTSSKKKTASKATSTPAAGDTLGQKSVTVKQDSVKAPAVPAKPDTIVVKADSTTLLLVSAAPDTAKPAPVASQDTARTKEAHPQDSPVDRGFLLRTLDGKAELRIRGSVRLNGVLDLNGLQSQSTFNTFKIPVGDENQEKARFTMTARQTRLGFEASKKAEFGELFAKVEADFAGSGDVMRLRHAYGTINRFLFGQTWSTFGDLTSIPLTVDLDGPNSSVSERTAQVRYGDTFTEGLIWDAAVESPSVEVTIPDSIKADQPYPSFPDIVFRTRYFGEWGHLQIATVLRSITVTKVSGDIEPRMGYGFLLSGRMYLDGSTPHRVLYQALWGKGIARYIGALAGEGLDVIYDPVTLEPYLTPVSGGYVSYAREWTPDLLMYITAGLLRSTDLSHLPDDGFRNSHYVSANLFWDVSAGTRVGVEYSWGRRENKDGAYGVANRFSFVAQYDF